MADFLTGIKEFSAGLVRKYSPSSVSDSLGLNIEGTSSGNDLAQSRYDFTSLVFPHDIGMDYMGHYMVININVPTKGLDGGSGVNEAAGSTDTTSQFSVLTQGNLKSKVDTLRFGGAGSSGSNSGNTRNAISLPRQTRRIAESIALFMPDGLIFPHQNVYQDIDLSANYGALGAIAKTALDIGAVAGRSPVNPSVEVVYTTTLLRKFVFDFNFIPRNDKEAESLKSIIKTLRFHAAPEISNSGFWWIPPAEFDITFFNKGIENTNLPRINTCVLDRIDVDYNPSGTYSTFRTGHPVMIKAIIEFREVEVPHKQRILQKF